MAKNEEYVHVKFLKHWQAHVAGDVASFIPSTAEKLVEAKIGAIVEVELKKPAPVAQVTKEIAK
jgi:hypothetical protein